MSIPRNWVEELASEWLSLEGYLVESNVRLKSAAVGGVGEADVVGIKLDDDGCHIAHIETGQLGNTYEKNLETVRRKFSPANKDAVEILCREKVAWSGEPDYGCRYIVTYGSHHEEMTAALAQDGITYTVLREFASQNVPETIHHWKQQQQTSGLRKYAEATLPDGYWLLKLLDFLVTELNVVVQDNRARRPRRPTHTA